MRTRRHLTAFIAGLLMSTACGHHHESTTDDPFITAMIPHHRLGVAMIDHAMPRVDDVRVRHLVFEMSNYHADELHELESHAGHSGLDEAERFPGWIDPDRLTALDQRPGPSYDVGWLLLMIEHHEGAVELAEDEIMRVENHPDDERRNLALRIATTQRSEIDRMWTLARFLCAEHPGLVECDLVKPVDADAIETG